jgi:hypothetical protein
MGNVLSDGLNNNVIRQRLSIKNPKDAISIITLVDLLIIVPSIVLFLTFNFRVLNSFGLPFLLVVLAFLFYLPVAILFASFFLSKRQSGSNDQLVKNNVLPTILFLMLVFSMLGIYIPSIEKLTLLIPSFGSLNVVGFAIVTMNVTFLLKNMTKFTKE